MVSGDASLVVTGTNNGLLIFFFPWSKTKGCKLKEMIVNNKLKINRQNNNALEAQGHIWHIVLKKFLRFCLEGGE